MHTYWRRKLLKYDGINMRARTVLGINKFRYKIILWDNLRLEFDHQGNLNWYASRSCTESIYPLVTRVLKYDL